MAIRLLLADDDAALRRVIQFKLKQKGYDVSVVENGVQAVEKLRQSEFDLLLSDMKMPGMNGLETLRKIREKDKTLSVIMITAHGTPNDMNLIP